MVTAVTILVALLLDKLLGEPKRLHPLVLFGRWVDFIEGRLNQDRSSKLNGVVAVILVLLPVVYLAVYIERSIKDGPLLSVIVAAFILYIAIGWQSLISHAKNIIHPMVSNDLKSSREALSMIVSRDTSELSEKDIAKAATESVLENGADAIFSALFWFFLLGIPGVVFYRLTNTLDAMWGYKNDRFLHFGWCAARLDDVLNFVPARLTAFSYALMGQFPLSIECWRAQGFSWKSPNAGPVMAAGAGALNVSLGGEAIYEGKVQQRPLLGPAETEQTKACFKSIYNACELVNKTIALWVVVIVAIAAIEQLL
ncbi:MAG: adenosylcobinamide-phosphate synthase [Oceanicoccus sp.]|jgi:adenosylcobinamide-phosphate synthase